MAMLHADLMACVVFSSTNPRRKSQTRCTGHAGCPRAKFAASIFRSMDQRGHLMSTANHSSRRVLLVEDEALVAMVAAETLIELGFDVVEAATARAALDHAGADHAEFEFAVIDLGLPDRPGEELIAELK